MSDSCFLTPDPDLCLLTPDKSGWPDSNRRFRVPETRGIATTLHPDCLLVLILVVVLVLEKTQPLFECEYEDDDEDDALAALLCSQYPGGESNPCLRIESPLSCH